jgi:uncharacterized protein
VVWDEAKNLANQRRHGISFEEAGELFASTSDYLEVFDEAHSVDEDRFIAIGPATRGVIVVVWTAPDDDDTFRIVSARWANKREQALYHRYIEESR